MEGEVLVSIIVPVYKTNIEYLKKCIESLINQTLKKIEIILVEDGSPDDCGKICDAYQKKDKRIIVIHQKNQGVSVARNNGMSIAKGKWIAFVDGDDWTECNMIERLYEKSKKGAYDIIMCSNFVNYPNRQVTNSFLNVEEKEMQEDKKDELELQLICKGINNYFPEEVGCGVPWAKLYNKEFIKTKGLKFNPNLIRMQDNIFNLYAFEEADRIYYFNEYLYHYRKNNKSVCNKYNPNIVEHFEKVNEQTKKFIERYDKPKIFEEALDVKIVMSFHSYLLLYFFNKKYTGNYLEKRKGILKLLNESIYTEKLKEVKLENCTKLEKVFVYCLQHKYIFMLFLLMKIKDLKHIIERKGI